MTEKELLKFLGCAVNDRDFLQLKEEFDLSDRKEFTNSSVSDGFKMFDVKNEQRGVFLEFMGKKRFKYEYLKVFNEYSISDENEHILCEITLEPSDESILLPFDLRYGFTRDQIISSLGPAREDYPFRDGYRLLYLIDDYKLMIALNDDAKLLWIRIWVIDLFLHWSIERLNTLDQQYKNLLIKDWRKILEFQGIKPSLKWQRYQLENFEELEESEKDESTTKYFENEFDFIEKADRLFDQFLEFVSNGLKEGDPKKIYMAVKDTIEKLNDLHELHNCIHTGEREDICEFIEKVIRRTGFKYHPDDDITIEWRSW